MRYIKRTNTDELLAWRKNLTAISLFSGCGGAALGVSQAGYNVRVAVEWDKRACETLRWNFTMAGFKQRHKDLIADLKKQGDKKAAAKWEEKGMFMPTWYKQQSKRKGFKEMVVLQADITKLPTKDILAAAGLQVGECSLLEGGFPCQGFSLANSNRAIDDPRNALYKECVRVIREACPRAFFLENVPGIVSMADGEVIRQVVEDLAAVGYEISWDILDAADYGVPQRRRRVILTGTRIDGMHLQANGNMALHIACSPGHMTHPKWYFDKYAKKNAKVKAMLEREGVNSSKSPNGIMLTIPPIYPAPPAPPEKRTVKQPALL
ncbi:MAG TPA: DNA (cytosine-5-)-methyltransferase [Alphaproteobacteria bacterium]|jgi:DNA (cytosine-5)-methyltransferase 1